MKRFGGQKRDRETANEKATWIWVERAQRGFTGSGFEAYKQASKKRLSSKPLRREEVERFSQLAKEMATARSSLFQILEYCVKEEPAVPLYIRHQVARGIWNDDDAKNLEQIVADGMFLDFLEIYEMVRAKDAGKGES